MSPPFGKLSTLEWFWPRFACLVGSDLVLSISISCWVPGRAGFAKGSLGGDWMFGVLGGRVVYGWNGIGDYFDVRKDGGRMLWR